jgi:hypothetical protein
MILYGAIFGCADPVLTIAAAMSHRSPFAAPIDKRDQADAARRALAAPAKPNDCTPTSDHCVLLRAYNGWQAAKSRGAREERAFLTRYFLSATTLKGMADLKRQFAELLSEKGALPENTPHLRRYTVVPVAKTVVNWVQATGRLGAAESGRCQDRVGVARLLLSMHELSLVPMMRPPVHRAAAFAWRDFRVVPGSALLWALERCTMRESSIQKIRRRGGQLKQERFTGLSCTDTSNAGAASS